MGLHGSSGSSLPSYRENNSSSSDVSSSVHTNIPNDTALLPGHRSSLTDSRQPTDSPIATGASERKSTRKRKRGSLGQYIEEFKNDLAAKRRLRSVAKMKGNVTSQSVVDFIDEFTRALDMHGKHNELWNRFWRLLAAVPELGMSGTVTIASMKLIVANMAKIIFANMELPWVLIEIGCGTSSFIN